MGPRYERAVPHVAPWLVWQWGRECPLAVSCSPRPHSSVPPLHLFCSTPCIHPINSQKKSNHCFHFLQMFYSRLLSSAGTTAARWFYRLLHFTCITCFFSACACLAVCTTPALTPIHSFTVVNIKPLQEHLDRVTSSSCPAFNLNVFQEAGCHQLVSSRLS